MVRMASRKFGSGVMSKNGVVVSTTAAGTSLGGGSVSAGSTATANNVYVSPSISSSLNNHGPSIKQIGGTGVISPNGVHVVASAGSGSESASINSNYKLSIASMLLAMKNQALGSLSLGGTKAGGSITENYSGINLG